MILEKCRRYLFLPRYTSLFANIICEESEISCISPLSVLPTTWSQQINDKEDTGKSTKIMYYRHNILLAASN